MEGGRGLETRHESEMREVKREGCCWNPNNDTLTLACSMRDKGRKP